MLKKQPLTQEERVVAYRHCPIVRMGVVDLYKKENDEIIPKNLCIGCQIYVNKVDKDKIEMVEW